MPEGRLKRTRDAYPPQRAARSSSTCEALAHLCCRELLELVAGLSPLQYRRDDPRVFAPTGEETDPKRCVTLSYTLVLIMGSESPAHLPDIAATIAREIGREMVSKRVRGCVRALPRRAWVEWTAVSIASATFPLFV